MLIPFTFTVFGLTVFREEFEDQTKSYPLFMAFVVLIAAGTSVFEWASTTTIKRALREPSKRRLASTEEQAAQGLLRTAQLYELDVGSLGKMPFSMAKGEPFNTILQHGNQIGRASSRQSKQLSKA